MSLGMELGSPKWDPGQSPSERLGTKSPEAEAFGHL